MSKKFSPAMNSQGWYSLSVNDRFSVVGGSASVEPAADVPDQVRDLATMLTEKLPDADWLIECDALGACKITVYLPRPD
jgi:NAD-dependent SIR2 family protein deacetylase